MGVPGKKILEHSYFVVGVAMAKDDNLSVSCRLGPLELLGQVLGEPLAKGGFSCTACSVAANNDEPCGTESCREALVWFQEKFMM